MAMMVYRRIKRVQRLLLALEARFLAGLVLTGGRSAGGAGAHVTDAGRVARPKAGSLVMPHGFGWLCPLMPSYAATYAGQLRVVLAEPGMVALLAACPQAVRILKPLCRMLGIETAVLRPGMVVVPRVVVERVRKPRVKMAVKPWRIPLPRGVLSAARRAGFGKIPTS